jgi:phage-related protein
MPFFNWQPSFNSSESSKPRISKAQFGDGYEQRIRMGCQTDPKTWQLEFNNRTNLERDEIRAFLESRGGAEAFNWTTPWGQTDRKWVCEEWNIDPSNCNNNQIRATFRQVYDWSLITEVSFGRPAWDSGYSQFRPGALTTSTPPVAAKQWVTSATTFAAGAVSAAKQWVTSATTFAPGFLGIGLPGNPVGWWDASDASLLTVVSGNISQLNDKSGNGWHLSQSDAALRPALATSSINGLSAMEWPSTDGNGFGYGGNAKRLYTSRTNAFVAGEIYAVVKFTGSSLNQIPGLIGPNNGDPWIAGQLSNTFYDYTFNQFFLNGGSSNQNGNLLPTMASTCLIRATLSGGGTVSTTSGIALGMDRDYGSLGRGWRGYICELIAYPSALSSGDRAELINTLRTKWGFPNA